MTCKDCVHYDVCHKRQTSISLDPMKCGYKCPDYKNNANFVELPCVAMVEQFIKDGKFDKKRVAHNGRFAVVYIDKSKWNCPLIDITEQFYNNEKALERIQALKEGADNENL